MLLALIKATANEPTLVIKVVELCTYTSTITIELGLVDKEILTPIQ